MPSWNDLLTEFKGQPDDETRGAWLPGRLVSSLQSIASLRSNRNVLLYATAFLQKPQLPGMFTGITSEDMNGLMSVIYGMDCSKGLTLVLHTPGGSINAAESLVAYLRSKFGTDIETIVPALAMSAGTMISLSSKRVVMGRQSQLGPIDPQLVVGNRQMSATGIVEQFEEAKRDILQDTTLAHLWAPVLQAHGPSLLVEARHALEYGERMVAGWLESGMFEGNAKGKALAKKVAKHFNDATAHKSHGRRIDIAEAAKIGVVTEVLEDDQSLQEAVLTAYHLATIIFEHSPTAKVLHTSHGRSWYKNHST